MKRKMFLLSLLFAPPDMASPVLLLLLLLLTAHVASFNSSPFLLGRMALRPAPRASPIANHPPSMKLRLSAVRKNVPVMSLPGFERYITTHMRSPDKFSLFEHAYLSASESGVSPDSFLGKALSKLSARNAALFIDYAPVFGSTLVVGFLGYLVLYLDRYMKAQKELDKLEEIEMYGAAMDVDATPKDEEDVRRKKKERPKEMEEDSDEEEEEEELGEDEEWVEDEDDGDDDE
jgi:hypothetical protein